MKEITEDELDKDDTFLNLHSLDQFETSRTFKDAKDLGGRGGKEHTTEQDGFSSCSPSTAKICQMAESVA